MSTQTKLPALSVSLVVLFGLSTSAEHIRDLQFSEPLNLQWRDVQRTGVTDKRNRFKVPFRVTRSRAEGSTAKVQTLNPGNVVVGDNTLVVGLRNSSDDPLKVTVHLGVSEGALIVGPASRKVMLGKRSSERLQGEATFTYRLKQIRKAIRFSVRVVDEAGKELCAASRGAIQPYTARLYASRCKLWQGDASVGFRIKYQLAPAELTRARTQVSLSRDGKALWKEKLPKNRTRQIRGRINTENLEPGIYELAARIKLGFKTLTTSRQTLQVQKRQSSEREKVALVVGVPKGYPGGAQVVSGGVPFPDGTLSDAGKVRVIDEAGTEIPCQADPTQWWSPDRRFVRWLLLSFRAGPAQKYFLEFGEAVSRTDTPKLATPSAGEDGKISSVHVDTGALRLDLDKNLNVRASSLLDGKWQTCADGKLGLSLQLLNRKGVKMMKARAANPGGVTLMKLPREGWRFKLDPQKAGVKERWFAAGHDDTKWAPIQTETFWEKQGFDADGTGWYRLKLDVPKAVVGQKLLLHFGACDEWAHIYVNDIDCGGNENTERNKAWITPFDIDISKAVKAGSNLLAVSVDDSAGAGGIWKPVELRVVNPSAAALEGLASKDALSGLLEAKDADITIEENGTQRTVVRLDGIYSRGEHSMKSFRLRLTARKGEPYLQIDHTFVFEQDPSLYLLDGIFMDWPARGGSFTVPGPNGSRTAKQSAQIYSLNSDDFQISLDGKQEKLKGRPLGWVDTAGARAGTMIFLRNMWQEFPGAVEADKDGVRVSIWPDDQPLDLGNISENWPGSDARGLAKTRRIFVVPHGPGDSAGLADSARRLDTPLTLIADPQWTNLTDVVGPMRPYDPKNYPDEEVALENTLAGMELQQASYKWFGLFDYGDFWHRWDRDKLEWMSTYRRCVNNETTYDPNMSYVWQLFLRRGDPGHFRFMESRQLHLIDVDTCHSDYQMPERVPGGYVDRYQYIPGVQHRHDSQHWNGGLSHHHTTIEDALLFYYITGNRRGLDMAEEFRRTNLRRDMHELGSNSHRDFSMPGRNAFESYLHFHDPELLDYALDSWETMRLYQGPGGRAITAYRRCYSQLGDERFAREYLTTEIVDESQPQPPLAELCKGKIEAWLFAGDVAGAEVALGTLKGIWRMNFGFVYSPLAQYKDENAKGSPVGYGWSMQAAGKFLPYMELPVRAGIGTKSKGTVKATKIGGNWSDGATWEGGKVPEPDHDIIIPAGSKVVIDVQARKRTCRSILVEGGLMLAQENVILAPHGDVVVAGGGQLNLIGGSLLFDCKWSGDFGLTVKAEAELKVAGVRAPSDVSEKTTAEAVTPTASTCRISALREDGVHNGYILIEKGGRASFKNAELSYLGGGKLDKFNQPWDDICRVGLAWASDELGFTVENCEFHHCIAGIVVSKQPGQNMPPARISNNVFHDCQTGIVTSYWIEKLRITENTFRKNGRGLDIRGGGYTKAWITNNQFIENEIGFDTRGRGGNLTDISGNRYTDNGIGISVIFNHQEATFRNETINGGRVGVRLEKLTGNADKTTHVTLKNCRIGIDKPNSESNINVEVEKAKVLVEGCKLGGPAKIVGNKKAVQTVDAFPDPGK